RCCSSERGRPLTDRSRLRSPSFVSIISRTCRFPRSSTSARYIQWLLSSSSAVNSLVTILPATWLAEASYFHRCHLRRTGRELFLVNPALESGDAILNQSTAVAR